MISISFYNVASAIVPANWVHQSQGPKTTPFDVITNLQNASAEQSGLGKFNVIVINLPELCSQIPVPTCI